MSEARRATIPTTSLVFGFGPMVPLVLAGAAAWVAPHPWNFIGIQFAIIWAALILAFVGGVRRGFGFAHDGASRVAEIAAGAAYLGVALLALLVPSAVMSLVLLAAGYALAALLDRRAALCGDAPLFFATLRPPQLLIGAAGLAACWAWLMM